MKKKILIMTLILSMCMVSINAKAGVWEWLVSIVTDSPVATHMHTYKCYYVDKNGDLQLRPH